MSENRNLGLGDDPQEEEIDSYYQSDSSRSRGSVVLYGLVALVVTLVVASGIYFGGRAIYRALNGTSDTDNVVEQTTSGQNDSTDIANEAADTSPETNEAEENSSNTNSSPSSSNDIPSTGDTPDSLPATGDSGL